MEQALRKYYLLYLLCWLCICSCKTSSTDTTPADRPGRRSFASLLKPYITESKDTLYEGSYSVYENRKQKGRKIVLQIIVVPAKNKDDLRSPIFYFQGGPGDAATGMVNYFLQHGIYRKNRDIVLVDFRGTGNSNPLHCPSTQVRTSAQYCMDEMYPIDSVKKCFNELTKIADLSQYTTEIAVEDVEEIRQWLGYDVINIMGQSYGTRACQSYMRQFPSVVRSAVMIGPVPTFMSMPLNHAYDGQKAWDILLQDCKDDSTCNAKYPSLDLEFNTLMNRLKKQSETFVYNDSIKLVKEKVIITHGPFADLLRSIMYSVKGQRQIPYLVHQAYTGNYQPLIEIAIDRNSEPYALADGFYLCVTCSEDVPYINSERVSELTNNAYMATYRIDQQIEACKVWGRNTVSENFRNPIESTIPAFVVSGKHDPITPTRWGDSIIQKMSNAQHLIIPQMAHGIRGLSNDDCFYEVIAKFFDMPNDKVDSGCIALMKPPKFYGTP